ncbi:MAG: transporter substrate-binding domain-containing protein [Hahellaceae bacterium]|nr:transporter substrate-binding domain-containing protein [Hahellaceae bacterium]
MSRYPRTFLFRAAYQLSWMLIATLGLYSGVHAAQLKQLSLATSEDFAPYVYFSTSGELRGIDYDIVREIFRRLDIQLKVSLLPRRRITKMLLNGELDGVISTTSYNDATALQQMWQSQPMYQSSVVIFSSKNNTADLDKTYRNHQFLPTGGGKVGLLETFDYSPMGQNNVSNMTQNAIIVRTDSQLVKLLLSARISYAITEDISFSYQARKAGKLQDFNNLEEVFTRPVNVALHADIITRHPELTDKLNHTIDRLVKEDFIAKTIYQYLKLEDES